MRASGKGKTTAEFHGSAPNLEGQQLNVHGKELLVGEAGAQHRLDDAAGVGGAQGNVERLETEAQVTYTAKTHT